MVCAPAKVIMIALIDHGIDLAQVYHLSESGETRPTKRLATTEACWYIPFTDLIKIKILNSTSDLRYRIKKF